MPSGAAAHLALMRATSRKGAGHIVELDTRQDPDDGLDAAPATLAESLGPRLGPAATFATTEHFNLQTARAITVSEANGRASVYLAALSGNLIALPSMPTGQRRSTGPPSSTHVGGRPTRREGARPFAHACVSLDARARSRSRPWATVRGGEIACWRRRSARYSGDQT